MKLKYLKLKGFKNLTGENNWFSLDFTNKKGTTVLIGNNGSGKSNILEAISAIFSDLYNINNNKRKKITFDYEIEYEIRNYHVAFTFVEEESRYMFYKYNSYGQKTEIDKFILKEYLPSNVLMIYSGDDTKILKQYYEPFTRQFQKIIKEGQSLPNLPKLLYLDKFFWTISLLSLLKSELNDNKEFCKRILKNNSLENIEILFTFNQNLMEKQPSFLNQLSNKEEEKFKYEEFKYNEMLPNEKELFIYLTSMVGQRNKVKKLTINNNGIDTINLSEGEKKQLLIRVALEILADENTLTLMDEPDSNIHVSNKIQIQNMIKEYSNRESILTTHSPSLTHSFNDKHIVMIVDGQVEDRTKQEIFSHISNGIWNYQEQSIFLSSTKDIILLVEGKHDKIHIEEALKKLKNQYHELNFDVFDMHGEGNIKHMILGLANNGVNFNGKKIIAIFDNDGAGRKAFKNNFKDVEGKDYKKLVDNDGHTSSIFYGLLLPKTTNFTNDFTIENMYSGEKYKDAFAKAFNDRTNNDFFNNFVDEVSKSIKEDSKNVLANNCKNFKDIDFKHFEKLFDLIDDIKDFK